VKHRDDGSKSREVRSFRVQPASNRSDDASVLRAVLSEPRIDLSRVRGVLWKDRNDTSVLRDDTSVLRDDVSVPRERVFARGECVWRLRYDGSVLEENGSASADVVSALRDDGSACQPHLHHPPTQQLGTPRRRQRDPRRPLLSPCRRLGDPWRRLGAPRGRLGALCRRLCASTERRLTPSRAPIKSCGGPGNPG